MPEADPCETPLLGLFSRSFSSDTDSSRLDRQRQVERLGQIDGEEAHGEETARGVLSGPPLVEGLVLLSFDLVEPL